MRIVATLALMVLTLTLVTGCEDGEARQRADIQNSLVAAGEELRQATAAGFVPGSEEFDNTRTALGRVIKNLNAINPADDGQKAVKALMTATALREAAIMDYAQVSAIEAGQQNSRDELLTKIDAITALAALADGQQKIDAAPDGQSLDKERQAAMQRLEELSKRLEQLAGPIGERTSANDTARKEVERLKTEVNDLRRQASELGIADGFVTYQKAIEARRKADKIEYDISQREMELGYSLQPDHDFADEESKHLQTRVEALQITHKELDAFSKATAESIAATRKQIVDLSVGVTAELRKVTDTAMIELAPLYEQAEAALQKAASMAGAGGAGNADDQSAARMLKARILELEGKFNAMKAASLADHQALLQKLNDAGKAIPSSDEVTTELEAAGAAMTAAVEKAKSSFTEAMDALSQVKSRDEAVEVFRKNLENAVAVLSGQGKAEAPKAPASGSGTASPVAIIPTDGPKTPEQLIEAAKAIYTGSDPLDVKANKLLAYTHAESPQGKALIAFNLDVLPAAMKFYSAMHETFGKEKSDAALGAAGMSVLPDFTTGTFGEKTETSAVYNYQRADGKPDKATLMKIGEVWFINGDVLDAESQQMLATKDLVGPIMKKLLPEIADRIKAGEFETPEQAVQAFQQGAQQAAAQMMGGNQPGRGAPPNPGK